MDNVQPNQGTQGRGESGDFSGLGVVHIRTRESMPDAWTVRLQGGSCGSERGFVSFSPALKNGDALFAYEGSHTDVHRQYHAPRQ